VSKYHKIIKAPLITEKNTMLRGENNKFVFEVEKSANKGAIKEAVEKLFDVKVEAVNTMIVKGKLKRMGRFSGYRSDKKKAIVRLAEGQSISKFGEV
jgi:large subunit ribosomal protein L23